MPAAELHELSAAIGGLREAVAQSKEDRERLERKLDKVAADVASVREDLNAAKNRGIGIVIGFGFVGSLIGAKVSPWIQKIIPAAVLVAVALGAARSAS